MTLNRRASAFSSFLCLGLLVFHGSLRAQLSDQPEDKGIPVTLKTEGSQNAESLDQVSKSSSEPQSIIHSGRIIRVAIDHPFGSLSKLKPGSELAGRVVRPVFEGDHVLIPAGSQVRLFIDHTVKEKLERKAPAGTLARLEMVRNAQFHVPAAYQVFLKPSSLTLPDGSHQELTLAFIRSGELIELHPKGSEIQLGDSSIAGSTVQGAKEPLNQVKDAKDAWDKYRHPMVTLRLDQDAVLPGLPLPAQSTTALPGAGPIIVQAGVRARLLLLSNLSAGESKQGELFQARLQEPIQREGQVLLPEGSIFHGHVARLVPPRRLSRAGTMQLSLDSVVLPSGTTENVVTLLSGAEVDRSRAVKMDAEGGLKGGNPSKKKAVAAVAAAIVVGQLTNEAVSSPLEIIASSAAGSAVGPFVGVGIGVLFYLAGRGKDVELPEYTELEITFGRPLTIPAEPQAASNPQTGPGTEAH